MTKSGALLVIATLVLTAGAQTGPVVLVEAPPELSAAAERVRRLDAGALAGTLARAGLESPPRVRVMLVPEDDPRAAVAPGWIVGAASPPGEIVIFADRATGYPYDSVEAVFHHELVHVALFTRAGGRALPRWFHEGVAVSVATGWDLRSRVRLLAATLGRPAISDVTRLFESPTEPDTQRAYLLAAALVHDLRTRHGAALPGAIARRVAAGAPFPAAFTRETGETVEEAAQRAWSTYARWTGLLAFVTDPGTVWFAILLLACLAFAVQVRRRRQRRQQWDDVEDDEAPGPY